MSSYSKAMGSRFGGACNQVERNLACHTNIDLLDRQKLLLEPIPVLPLGYGSPANEVQVVAVNGTVLGRTGSNRLEFIAWASARATVRSSAGATIYQGSRCNRTIC